MTVVEMKSMAPRWKGKASRAKALDQPMSKTISNLQSLLSKLNSKGLLSGSSVLVEADPDQTDLLNLTCFGRPILTSQSDKQWFQLSLEEAFYLFNSLNCLQIVGSNGCAVAHQELWQYMCKTMPNFPSMYKAYAHLRMKNWVVRPGSQYGVDYVAYRHHPALVHSEYAVLVMADANADGRLRVWSDFHCTLRLCGSVAKTLLVLEVRRGNCELGTVGCLEKFSVLETTVTRWNPERNREIKFDARSEDNPTVES